MESAAADLTLHFIGSDLICGEALRKASEANPWKPCVLHDVEYVGELYLLEVPPECEADGPLHVFVGGQAGGGGGRPCECGSCNGQGLPSGHVDGGHGNSVYSILR